MASCCPPGSEGALAATHEPRGTEVSIPDSDLKAYTVGTGEAAVIHYYDIFGFNGGRFH